jgi:hypothetical protein
MFAAASDTLVAKSGAKLPGMEEPRIEDRGSHLEVSLSAQGFGETSFVDVLAAAVKRFGAKPILVICDDPGHAIATTRAYDVGVELSGKLPLSRIAIALTRRKSSAVDRFTELVAENRGTDVRYFESVEQARSWLGVS